MNCNHLSPLKRGESRKFTKKYQLRGTNGQYFSIYYQKTYEMIRPGFMSLVNHIKSLRCIHTECYFYCKAIKIEHYFDCSVSQSWDVLICCWLWYFSNSFSWHEQLLCLQVKAFICKLSSNIRSINTLALRNALGFLKLIIELLVIFLLKAKRCFKSQSDFFRPLTGESLMLTRH